MIEMHDQILGGTNLRYVPTYYGYGKRQREGGAGETHGFDTVWGFELMWSPMKDLVGGHSMALYYYNLAYSLPLYLHIDLRKDNPQCLMFWWNASTCRHLGIGGTHPDPAVRKAQKDAMTAYRRLGAFLQGRERSTGLTKWCTCTFIPASRRRHQLLQPGRPSCHAAH